MGLWLYSDSSGHLVENVKIKMEKEWRCCQWEDTFNFVPPFLHSFNKCSWSTLYVLVLACACSALADAGEAGIQAHGSSSWKGRRAGQKSNISLGLWSGLSMFSPDLPCWQFISIYVYFWSPNETWIKVVVVTEMWWAFLDLEFSWLESREGIPCVRTSISKLYGMFERANR